MSIFERIEINRRDRLLKSVLKKKGAEAKAAGDQKTVDAISCLLDDGHEECFESFAAGVESEFADRPVPFFGPLGGALMDLLNWLMENWPAILEMIMQIIDLFTHPAPDPA